MEASTAPEVPRRHPLIWKPAAIPKGKRVAVQLTHYSSPASLFLQCKLHGISGAEGQDYFPISSKNSHVQDAFTGMPCLICHDNSTRLALRALVTDVYRNLRGIPLKVDVQYVDTGLTDVVWLNRVYAIDEEAAAQPQKAIPCCIRGINPTAASSRYDLKQLWKQSTLFEAVFYTTHNAGVCEVDLYAKCPEKTSRLKTYDVGKYLVKYGFATLVAYFDDTPEPVGISSRGGVVNASCNVGEAIKNNTLQRPVPILRSSSEAPGGSRIALDPVPSLARPCDGVSEDDNGPLYRLSLNAEDPIGASYNVSGVRSCRIDGFYAGQGFRRQEDCSIYSHDFSGSSDDSERIIDPVKPLRPPEVGSCVLGQVSAVFSPSSFYLVLPYGRRSIERLSTEGMGDNSRETLENLTRDMQVAYDRGSLLENRRMVKTQGGVVAAKSNLDRRWYRARVVSLEEEDRVKVFYIDFGFCESLPVDQVKPLEARFTHLPQQALQACLVTDKANNKLGYKRTWDDHACQAFANCVSERDLVVKIVRVTPGLLHVQLFFTNGDQLGSVWRCLKKIRETETN